MFEFNIEGIESLQKDYEKYTKDIEKGIIYGLKAVQSELIPSLQKHIQEDVYKTYEPKSYIRRKENGGLIDSDVMTHSIKGNSLVFEYNPSGYNPRYKNMDFVNGDELINRIENSLYDWERTGKIPERHFWDNFVHEMFDEGGQAEKIFVNGMNGYSKDLQVISDGNIHTDSSDTYFQKQQTMEDYGVSFDSDDEMPY